MGPARYDPNDVHDVDVEFLDAVPDDADEMLDTGPANRRRWTLPVLGLAVAALVTAALVTRSGGEPAPAPTSTPVAVPQVPSAAPWPEGGFGADALDGTCPRRFECATAASPAPERRVIARAVTDRLPGARRIEVSTRTALDLTTGRLTLLVRTVNATLPDSGVLAILISTRELPRNALTMTVLVRRVVHGVHVLAGENQTHATPVAVRRGVERLARDVRLLRGLP